MRSGLAARLARENRWTTVYAERVVTEYLCFVHLAAVSGETVTPSVAVDQAWHLHLCSTRSHWHHLCREVLGRELHHGLTHGGVRESVRHHECYERTLRIYHAEFGPTPPIDIWPPASRRFAPDSSPVSVAPKDYFILPKFAVRRAALLPRRPRQRRRRHRAPLLLLPRDRPCRLPVPRLPNIATWPKDRDGGCAVGGCGSHGDSGCGSDRGGED